MKYIIIMINIKTLIILVKKIKDIAIKKNRKNNKIDFRALELEEEDDDIEIDRYWDETGL